MRAQKFIIIVNAIVCYNFLWVIKTCKVLKRPWLKYKKEYSHATHTHDTISFLSWSFEFFVAKLRSEKLANRTHTKSTWLQAFWRKSNAQGDGFKPAKVEVERSAKHEKNWTLSYVDNVLKINSFNRIRLWLRSHSLSYRFHCTSTHSLASLCSYGN